MAWTIRSMATVLRTENVVRILTTEIIIIIKDLLNCEQRENNKQFDSSNVYIKLIRSNHSLGKKLEDQFNSSWSLA